MREVLSVVMRMFKHSEDFILTGGQDGIETLGIQQEMESV
jgi:hypothetical protein